MEKYIIRNNLLATSLIKGDLPHQVPNIPLLDYSYQTMTFYGILDIVEWGSFGFSRNKPTRLLGVILGIVSMLDGKFAS